MPGENCHGPIQLFASHHPDQLVGPGHSAEAQHAMRHRAKRWVETVRPADRDRIGWSRRVTLPADVGGPFLAARRTALARRAKPKRRPWAWRRGLRRLLRLAVRPADASAIPQSRVSQRRQGPRPGRSAPVARSSDRTAGALAPPSVCPRKSARGACSDIGRFRSWRLRQADRRSTSSQGYRTGERLDGRRARSHFAHRAAPNRKAACLQLSVRDSRRHDRL